jgi:glycosyltransferase involved in cell wall biosynthesis
MNISIAMTTYNGARFLDQQLASLATQSKQPFEVVVCDDGSTDSTVEILRAWAASVAFPVHIYQNEQKLGFKDNFWKAANLCSGDLIAFCDQDDVWLEDKLQGCAAEFAHSDVLLVMHSAKLVDSELRFLGKNHPPISKRRVAEPLDVNPWGLVPGFALVFSSKILRGADWEGRPEDHLGPGYPMGHDHWVYLMASVLGRIVFLPDCLALYRRHQTNTTGSVDRTVKKFVRQGIDTGEDGYKHLANLSLERSEYLNRLSERTDNTARSDYKNASLYYQKLSKSFTLRASIHSSRVGFLKKASYILKLLLGRAYRDLDRGGLGPRAFVKDVFFSVARH